MPKRKISTGPERAVTRTTWRDRVIADAKSPRYLGVYDIPFTEYTVMVTGDPTTIVEVVFTHKRTRADLVLSAIIANHQGEILQAGTN
jgi:hypothetical protein